jgi:catechol 2,3-dioxygenase-like lactoylglutathione lyase family enzyme
VAPSVKSSLVRPNRTDAAVLRKATLTAFLATTDGPRSKAFYESVLGLRLKTDDEFAVAFDCNGVELRVQKVKDRFVVPSGERRGSLRTTAPWCGTWY